MGYVVFIDETALFCDGLLEVLYLVAHSQSLGGFVDISDELEGRTLLLGNLIVQPVFVLQEADLFVDLRESLGGTVFRGVVLFAAVVEGQETVGTQGVLLLH